MWIPQQDWGHYQQDSGGPLHSKDEVKVNRPWSGWSKSCTGPDALYCRPRPLASVPAPGPLGYVICPVFQRGLWSTPTKSGGNFNSNTTTIQTPFKTVSRRLNRKPTHRIPFAPCTSEIFLSNFQGRHLGTFQYAVGFRGPGILIKRFTIVDLSVYAAWLRGPHTGFPRKSQK